jgi:hypothetical protein
MKQVTVSARARFLAFPEASEKHFMHGGQREQAALPPFTRLIHAAWTHAFVCIALIAVACSAPRGTPSAASSTPEQAAASAPTPRAPPLDLTGSAPWPSPYHDDVLWTRAARGDALDRHTLAQREGARGLLTALALGGDLGRTALAALPLAPDARDGGAELCQLIANAGAPTREWLLGALHALLLPDPARTFEPDAEASRTCRERLVALDTEGSLAASEHDLVASALVYLTPTSAR